jgi:threonyl-tRNA synthetase
MRELIKQGIPFNKRIITRTEAKELFKDQPYKLDLIENLQDNKVSLYQSGDFVDLCRGPHVKTAKEITQDAFKLTKIAGAYWKGDEKNPMLQRIYAVAFMDKKSLDDFLEKEIEAEKRDHRKIGAKLDLFSFQKEAPGIPFFHPKGTIVYNELKNFWIEKQKEFDYDMILAPSMLDINIWKQSGHWDHYKEDMFFLKAKEGEQEFALKPMDCPGAILIYNNSPKSYRDLPLRYAEPGLISRNEKSGQLGGLFRVRQFTQDDAHIFITEDQIEEEIEKVISLINKIYKPFGLKYKAYLSTRPDDFMGDLKLWNNAEGRLRKILRSVYGKNWGIKAKDGAFYGPKIDYQLEDAIGRNWQCATIQLDFQMPLKFGCKFTDQNGEAQTPVLTHRTIMGSFERFMGILIEHFAGNLPLWLSPIQIQVIPVGERHKKYAESIAKELKKEDIRAFARIDNESVGKKIREGEMQRIPYLLIVGDREMQNKTIGIRERGKGDLGAIGLPDFLEQIKAEIKNKKIK